MKSVVLLALAGVALAASYDSGLFSKSKYYDYSEIVGILAKLQRTYGRTVVSVGRLDRQTTEGRNIPFVQITGGSGSNKKKIFIEAGIHAREWIGPAAALDFIDRILAGRLIPKSEAAYLFANFDWFVVPLANPDGYQFSRDNDRLWRKNRDFGNCEGVDLNRNFGVAWGKGGSSSNCHSDTYRGPNAFSEPETAAIKSKVEAIGGISAYISLSSYGQTLATPFAYTDALPRNNKWQTAISTKASNAIKAATGKDYKVANANHLYTASGTGTDWAFVEGKVPYSLAFALRPEMKDGAGFRLPASQIVPTGDDVFAALNAIAREL